MCGFISGLPILSLWSIFLFCVSSVLSLLLYLCSIVWSWGASFLQLYFSFSRLLWLFGVFCIFIQILEFFVLILRSLSFSYKATNSIMETPPSWPRLTLSTSHRPSKYHHLGAYGFNILFWGECKYSVHNTYWSTWSLMYFANTCICWTSSSASWKLVRERIQLLFPSLSFQHVYMKDRAHETRDQ